MSEYQYYEFRAVDRALTRAEQAALRAVSTRAEITATSFINEYNWGDFKGDPDEWMALYFDAFLYLANWGSRVLKLRIPGFDPSFVADYCGGECCSAQEVGSHFIVTFSAEDIFGENWDDGEGLLESMISIRSELARGDFRPLYLGWILSVLNGEVSDEDLEVPVPPGLGDLTASQMELVDFFEIDEDFIEVAARVSAPLAEGPPDRELIEQWIASVPVAEQHKLLARLIAGDEPGLANVLLCSATKSRTDQRVETGRTVGDLRLAAGKAQEIRERAEAERKAAEKARRERESAAAREKHLAGLVGHEAWLWGKVEELAGMKVGARYDEAVHLLVVMRDLAERDDPADYHARLARFRVDHAKQPALIQRIDHADL